MESRFGLNTGGRMEAIMRAKTDRTRLHFPEAANAHQADVMLQKYGGRIALVIVESPVKSLTPEEADELIARLAAHNFDFGQKAHIKPFVSDSRPKGVQRMEETARQLSTSITEQTVTSQPAIEAVVYHVETALSVAKLCSAGNGIVLADSARSAFIGVLDKGDFGKEHYDSAPTSGNAVLVPQEQGRLAQWRVLR